MNQVLQHVLLRCGEWARANMAAGPTAFAKWRASNKSIETTVNVVSLLIAAVIPVCSLYALAVNRVTTTEGLALFAVGLWTATNVDKLRRVFRNNLTTTFYEYSPELFSSFFLAVVGAVGSAYLSRPMPAATTPPPSPPTFPPSPSAPTPSPAPTAFSVEFSRARALWESADASPESNLGEIFISESYTDPISMLPLQMHGVAFVLDDCITTPVSRATMLNMFGPSPIILYSTNPFTNLPIGSIRKVRIEAQVGARNDQEIPSAPTPSPAPTPTSSAPVDVSMPETMPEPAPAPETMPVPVRCDCF